MALSPPLGLNLSTYSLHYPIQFLNMRISVFVLTTQEINLRDMHIRMVHIILHSANSIYTCTWLVKTTCLFFSFKFQPVLIAIYVRKNPKRFIGYEFESAVLHTTC